jgi:multimeric flavodoxin WrbA
MTMPTLLIVYHSMTGGTEQMVQACVSAACVEPNVVVRVKHASDTNSDDMFGASGYIFATPEYLGSMSGLVKDFFDRTYYDVIDHIQGRPYAAMICAGSDGHGAARQIQRIVTGWRLKPVAAPVIVNVAAQSADRIKAAKQLNDPQLAPCAELGSLLGTGLALSVF